MRFANMQLTSQPSTLYECPIHLHSCELVTDDQKTLLKADITRANLLKGAQQLEDFAYASKERNRLIGSPGHNDTVYWLKSTLESLDGYYSVSLQEFSTVVQLNGSINSFTVDGAVPPAGSFLLFDYSPSGNVSAPLVVVNNLGCNA